MEGALKHLEQQHDQQHTEQQDLEQHLQDGQQPCNVQCAVAPTVPQKAIKTSPDQPLLSPPQSPGDLLPKIPLQTAYICTSHHPSSFT
jgi:pyridoxine 5'-phosphate synthase PdxJ